jgi:hypothetical protein
MGFIHMTHAESPVRQLGGLGVLRGVRREGIDHPLGDDALEHQSLSVEYGLGRLARGDGG